MKQGEGYGSRELSHTGNFVFSLTRWGDKRVTDGKKKLESKIAIILAKLELEGKREKKERVEWEIRRREQKEKDRIAREVRERKEKELKKFTDLFKKALQLHHATILRSYIEQLHANSNVSKEWCKMDKRKG